MLSPILKRVNVRDEVVDEGLGGGHGPWRPQGSKNRPKAERTAKTKGQIASLIQNFNNDV